VPRREQKGVGQDGFKRGKHLGHTWIQIKVLIGKLRQRGYHAAANALSEVVGAMENVNKNSYKTLKEQLHDILELLGIDLLDEH